ncbi:MAG: hypothetical protein QM576_11550 [Rhodopseudomonas sp.]|uniref:hypothetical protein n=1 Tax=Rhodopseudomonas sp. TaxID=1078 RepID=UPI0039E64CA3
MQLLLAGVVATQMAVAANGLTTEICSSIDSHSTDHAGSKARLKNASCAVCGLASFSAPPLQFSTAPLLGPVLNVAHSRICSEPIRRADRFEPRSSQGPPQHA